MDNDAIRREFESRGYDRVVFNTYGGMRFVSIQKSAAVRDGQILTGCCIIPDYYDQSATLSRIKMADRSYSYSEAGHDLTAAEASGAWPYKWTINREAIA